MSTDLPPCFATIISLLTHCLLLSHSLLLQKWLKSPVPRWAVFCRPRSPFNRGLLLVFTLSLSPVHLRVGREAHLNVHVSLSTEETSHHLILTSFDRLLINYNFFFQDSIEGWINYVKLGPILSVHLSTVERAHMTPVKLHCLWSVLEALRASHFPRACLINKQENM